MVRDAGGDLGGAAQVGQVGADAEDGGGGGVGEQDQEQQDGVGQHHLLIVEIIEDGKNIHVHVFD